MSKEIKVTVVPPEMFLEEDYRDVSKWYIVGATGDRYYFHCVERSTAQEICDSEFGKGKYKIRTNKIQKGNAEISCRGSLNSKSRSGTFVKNLHAGQGRG